MSGITFSEVLNATLGVVDSGYTQSSTSNATNAAVLNANIVGFAATALSWLLGGAGTIVGFVGSGAAGVGLGISVGGLFTGTPEERLSAGLGVLAGVAGVIATNPFVPP
jgi:hypothetical protein